MGKGTHRKVLTNHLINQPIDQVNNQSMHQFISWKQSIHQSITTPPNNQPQINQPQINQQTVNQPPINQPAVNRPIISTLNQELLNQRLNQQRLNQSINQ